MLISSECYHLYVSIGVLYVCMWFVCIFMLWISTVAVSMMCMFAVFIYMYIVWVLHSFNIFYNHKEPVSLLIVYYCFSYCYYYYLLIVSSFIPRKAKNTDFSASKLRPSRMRTSKAHLEAGPVIYSY